MGIARRYIIQFTEIKPVGISAETTNTTYNLTIAFSGVRSDDSVYSYGSISLLELSQLSNVDYEQRVSDFLSFINIDSVQVKNELIENASYDNPNCELP